MQTVVKPAFMLFTALALVLAIAACGSDEPEPQPTEEVAETDQATVTERQRRSESVAESRPSSLDEPVDERPVPRLRGEIEEGEGYGMTILVDASSPEAFRESLRMIAQDSTDAEYQVLDSSIRFIRLYSPRVMNDPDRLRELLHEQTGEEIIEMARELNRERSGG